MTSILLPTGWGEVKTAMIADAAAGFTPAQIAKRSGWGVRTVFSVRRAAGVEQPNTTWSDAEKAAIRPATSKREAIALYRAAMGPEARRTDMAIRSRWMRGGPGRDPTGRGRVTPWSDAEKAAIRPATSKEEAITLYRARFPDSNRTPSAIRKMYNKARRDGSAFHGLAKVQEGLV